MNLLIVLPVALGLAQQPSMTHLLAGTDSLPDAAAVAAADLDALLAVVADRDASVVARARAVRLLGKRSAGEGEAQHIDDVLGALFVDVASSPALRAQVLLGRAERAWRRGDAVAVTRFADAGLRDPASPVAVAGVLVWWSIGGDIARGRLEGLQHGGDHPVAGAARGRLRQWRRAGRWAADRVPAGDRPPADRAAADDGDVLDPAHGGPSPAR